MTLAARPKRQSRDSTLSLLLLPRRGSAATSGPDDLATLPPPVGVLTSLAQVRAYYEMLFPSLRGESVMPIMRLYGDDFLVDETLWTGEITDGHWCLCDGMSGSGSFRLLHVFDFAADGKIKSERAWVDLAAIQQRLSPAERPTHVVTANR